MLQEMRNALEATAGENSSLKVQLEKRTEEATSAKEELKECREALQDVQKRVRASETRAASAELLAQVTIRC